MKVCFRLHADPRRAVIVTTERTPIDMIWQVRYKWFMVLWNTELLRGIVCREQGIEETVEFASTYETDVADFHRHIWSPWTWLPQGMSELGVLDCQLFAKYVVVGHCWMQGSNKKLRGLSGLGPAN
jgi:hypothetical protein